MPRRDPPSLFAAAPLPVAVLDDAERLACLRLIRSTHVGPVTFRELINHFGSAKAALDGLPSLAQRASGRVKICPEREAAAELDAATRIGARAVFTIEPGYPPALAAIDAPPPLLYVKGRSELLRGPSLAIVGSRHASAAGIKLARNFARDLSGAGLVIVSGLARGIDAAAHEASIDAGTVAVLAGGLDIVYPPEHDVLQARIGETGCLLTEQPPGFTPRARDFPRRNRLVSGLSFGVVVIEAARRSGTLVTRALRASKDARFSPFPAILSIPARRGPINSSSRERHSSLSRRTCSRCLRRSLLASARPISENRSHHPLQIQYPSRARPFRRTQTTARASGFSRLSARIPWTSMKSSAPPVSACAIYAFY